MVASSILAIGFGGIIALAGEVPEWTKGADCKSAGLCLRRFESFPLHHPLAEVGGENGVYWLEVGVCGASAGVVQW